MAAVYVDTSALGRVLLDEADRGAIVEALADFEQVVASRLLRVELRRLGARRGVLDRADSLLGGISLIPMDNRILTAVETLAPTTVGTLDAIHLATAIALREGGKLKTLMTYDRQLANGARQHGITVLTPGPTAKQEAERA